jgi:transmembrane sensor
MTQEEAYNLMVKKLAGEIDEIDEVRLQQWLEASRANCEIFEELSLIWGKAQREPIQVDVDAAWGKVKLRTQHKTIFLSGNTLYKIAAAAVLLAIFGTWAFISLRTVTTTITTAAREIKKVDLPDGSFVWMHEHSTLTYTNNLKGNKRMLNLDGMAFFDVKRNETKPFVIITNRGSVEVLGTSFEVAAYKNDSFERVTVSTGKVKFRNKQHQESLTLTANTEGLITAKGKVSSKQVNSAELIAWRTSKLSFDNEQMDAVAKKLERYFHIQVILKNPAITSCRFTADFNNPKLNEVLDVLAKALQLTHTQQGNRVIFDGQGCSIKQ